MKSKTTLPSGCTIPMILLLLALLVGSCAVPFITAETVQITVTDKERIITGSGESLSSKYLVFTESETFENSDCLVLGKFDSSDLQGKLKAGSSYQADVYGWRVPLLSMYRNIVSAKKIK